MTDTVASLPSPGRYRWRVPLVLGITVVIAYLDRINITLALPLIAWFSPLRAVLPERFELLLPLMATVVGFVGPSYWLDRRARRRQDEIERPAPSAPSPVL